MKNHKIGAQVFCAIYILHTFLFALALSWCALFNMNFLYGFWHDHTGIDKAIATYGPKNKYKEGFAQTSKKERVRLFKAINHSVHNEGEGLENITYFSPANGVSRRFLREPEVVHLQDVANLISFFKPLFWYALAALPLITLGLFFVRRKKIISFTLPTWKQHIGVLICVAGLIVIPMLIMGAQTVFNQLHIWVFPDEHQWFFYYQESLMSTLMYAPNLFGWIGAAWALLAVIIYGVTQGLMLKNR